MELKRMTCLTAVPALALFAIVTVFPPVSATHSISEPNSSSIVSAHNYVAKLGLDISNTESKAHTVDPGTSTAAKTLSRHSKTGDTGTNMAPAGAGDSTPAPAALPAKQQQKPTESARVLSNKAEATKGQSEQKKSQSPQHKAVKNTEKQTESAASAPAATPDQRDALATGQRVDTSVKGVGIGTPDLIDPAPIVDIGTPDLIDPAPIVDIGTPDLIEN